MAIAYLTAVEVPAQDRSYWRYFSIDQQQPELSLTALNKLLNHLSWERQIVAPALVDSTRGIVRIDLRDYMWDANSWDRVLAEYPYGTAADTSAARRWNLLSDASSRLAIKSVDRVSVTAFLPRGSGVPANMAGPGLAPLRKLGGPGNMSPNQR